MTDSVVNLTKENFAAHINDRPFAVVDFWAPWCGPCKAMAPEFERAAAALEPEARLVKVNVDEEPALAERYRVRGIPYVAMFRDGKLAEQVVGYRPKAALEAGLGLNGKLV